MGYKMIKKGRTHHYDILESETNHLIEISGSKKGVSEIVRKLALGAGFKGNTPKFFMQKMKGQNMPVIRVEMNRLDIIECVKKAAVKEYGKEILNFEFSDDKVTFTLGKVLRQVDYKD